MKRKWILAIVGLVLGGVLEICLVVALHAAISGPTSHYELIVQAVIMAPLPLGGAVAGFAVGRAIDRRSQRPD
ncbi:MAG: hypothetical protein ACYS8Z_23510 [Planctomycetota bacterium]|jgi:hypothetical protein